MLSLKTAPTVEPVDLVTAKGHLRIDHDYEDERIENILIPTARQWVEGRTNRQLIQATYELTLPAFPACGIIRLPRPPLINTAPLKPAITYKDTAGATQTLAESVYVVETSSDPWARPGRITLAFAQLWPTTLEQEDAVKVTFSCGYGTAGRNVPAPLLSALLLILSELYEFRTEQTSGRTVTKNLLTAERLCEEFLVESFD